VPDAVTTCDPEVAAAVGAAAALLADLGHRVEESAPGWDDPDFSTHFVNAYAVWAARELDHFGGLVGEPVTAAGVEPATWAIAELGRTVTGVQYHEAIDHLHAYTRRVTRWWAGDDGDAGSAGHDVLVCPTVPEPPPVLGSYDGGPDNPLHGLFRSAEVVPFTAPFNTTGQPAISLPLGRTSTGLPIGVQLVAAGGREDVLIRLAAQLEAAAPWADRRPPA
jgi:amidase